MATVGKKELATALGWTRPRLDRRLDSDGSFPVRKRGDRAGGWEFDLPAVKAYLNGGEPMGSVRFEKEEAESHAVQVLDALKKVPEGKRAPATHRGEQSAKQRLELAKAVREENRARRESEQLVLAEELRQVLTVMLARFGKGLDTLPDTLCKQLNLPEENIEVIRVLTDELRRTMVGDLRALFGTELPKEAKQ